MEPGKFDSAIRELLNGHLYRTDGGEKERIWNSLEGQLPRRQSHGWWKVAALILLLLMPSAILWKQNRNQAATISLLSQRISDAPISEAPQAIILHDTIIRQVPAVVVTKTDTLTQIRIVQDTVVVYRPEELAVEPENTYKSTENNVSPVGVTTVNFQESQRAEFLLNPENMHTARKQKANRSFTFRFSLGGVPESNSAPVGLQTRL